MGFTCALQNVTELIRVRVSSIGRTKRASGSLGFACVLSVGPSGSRVHPRSRGFTRARHWLVGFIGFAWVNFGTPRCSGVHSGSRGFTGGTPMGHAGPSVSRGFTRARLVVVRFIRVLAGLVVRS